ncbi:MAG: hypothetical protein JO019_01310 [Candidatus Kaiserbacteria bacterium]|nr:hypothetical protein [Candidatus Kaiserbacteria bacterium]
MPDYNESDTRFNIDTNTPDIRRRFRERYGAASYTLKVLVDALRLRGKPLRGSRVAVLGIPFGRGDAQAEELRTYLLRAGARLASIDEDGEIRRMNDELEDQLCGADAVVISSAHPLFRAVRPREFKELGVDIVIPIAPRA